MFMFESIILLKKYLDEISNKNILKLYALVYKKNIMHKIKKIRKGTLNFNMIDAIYIHFLRDKWKQPIYLYDGMYATVKSYESNRFIEFKFYKKEILIEEISINIVKGNHNIIEMQYTTSDKKYEYSISSFETKSNSLLLKDNIIAHVNQLILDTIYFNIKMYLFIKEENNNDNQ